MMKLPPRYPANKPIHEFCTETQPIPSWLLVPMMVNGNEYGPSGSGRASMEVNFELLMPPCVL